MTGVQTCALPICPRRDGCEKGTIEFEGQTLDFRLNVTSVRGGTHYVFRFLTADFRGEYKLHPKVQKIIDRALLSEGGLITVSGPTGAGKSSLLYHMLERLDRKQRAVVSIEDPVEQLIEGVTQGTVSQSSGRGFPDMLRQLMRSDPDVILISEIRDAETAQMATQSAMCGCLILASLHAYDALQVAHRLEELDIPKSILQSCFRATVGIRLVKSKDGRGRVAVVSAYEQQGGKWVGVSLKEAITHAAATDQIDIKDAEGILFDSPPTKEASTMPGGLKKTLDTALRQEGIKKLIKWLPALQEYYKKGLSVEQIMDAIKAEGVDIAREELQRRLTET